MFAADTRRFLEDDKFLIKYQIFIKGVWVIVIYSLEDTADSRQRILEDGYEIVEMGDVRLPRRPRILSLIVSLDDAAEIAPEKKLFSYNDLAGQTSIKHKARLVSTEAGKHLLQLVIASGHNICHEAPFDAVLTIEDLYHRKDVSVHELLQIHDVGHYWALLQGAGFTTVEIFSALDKSELKEIGVTAVGDRIRIMRAVKNSRPEFANLIFKTSEGFSSIHDCLRNLGLGALAPLFKKEDILYATLIDMDEEDLKDIGITEEKYRKAIIQATKGIPEEANMDQHRFNPIYDTSQDVSVEQLLQMHDVGHYWTLLQGAGVTTVEIFSAIDKSDLKEIGVAALGDRIRIMRAVQNSRR
uniref:uncharacterized protein LOC120327849 n=1 Tax=Styela clava TaxID=7725 RepID=UPI001939DDAF|nr:uncharacterized protein LOC120327849 [Styela clava]